jgi:hypothetical protein
MKLLRGEDNKKNGEFIVNQWWTTDEGRRSTRRQLGNVKIDSLLTEGERGRGAIKRRMKEKNEARGRERKRKQEARVKERSQNQFSSLTISLWPLWFQSSMYWRSRPHMRRKSKRKEHGGCYGYHKGGKRFRTLASRHIVQFNNTTDAYLDPPVSAGGYEARNTIGWF